MRERRWTETGKPEEPVWEPQTACPDEGTEVAVSETLQKRMERWSCRKRRGYGIGEARRIEIVREIEIEIGPVGAKGGEAIG